MLSVQKYLIFSEGKIWEDAREHCIDLGRHLIEVKTDEAYAGALLIKQNIDGDFWLGGNDIRQEGTWVWDSNGDSIEDNYWKNDNHRSKGNEDCLVMKKDDELFHDRRCSDEYPFVCEWI